ncbi:hypothetical protein CPB86DRAFT_802455 [Serendipita vermifera]|nr:hypothetical protein CPB86DRAFT_802455 [Serendipita vermifera]
MSRIYVIRFSRVDELLLPRRVTTHVVWLSKTLSSEGLDPISPDEVKPKFPCRASIGQVPITNNSKIYELKLYTACSIITFCFARRFTWKHLTLNRICALAIFLDSWVFVYWGGLVATGIGMSKSPRICLTGIYLCISFYGSSKVLTYIFLADRVYLVWSANNPVSRRNSKIWILCGVVLLGYVVCFVLMIIAKIAYIRSDGNCVIGLEGAASIPLLVYDSFLNIFLTTLFAWPLLRRKLSNPKLRALAKRTCL